MTSSPYPRLPGDPGFEEMIAKHAPLVKRIAYHLMARLPASVLVDDLIQAGMVGLLEATKNYNAELGASFETYAGIRIRGSMLDELRRNDWAPKSVHRKTREVTEVVRAIEARTGRDARDEEVANEMGITLKEYYKILQDANSARMFGFEELGVDEEALETGMLERTGGPLDDIQDERFKSRLVEAIAGLPEREKMVVTLYYDSELNLREIGSVIGVSESRISQLLSQAMIRLRARMKEWVSD
ncbi:MAG: RNA polymerase sigma factor FliA [Gammaproteobacteria bacterium]|nr:RNA polymerase sigma factor FliA [Gammaproteobacteria bacterium]MDH5728702.1 RNA polymerase sigma factor FliA [Gammaproteobacteria bacterium]